MFPPGTTVAVLVLRPAVVLIRRVVRNTIVAVLLEAAASVVAAPVAAEAAVTARGGRATATAIAIGALVVTTTRTGLATAPPRVVLRWTTIPRPEVATKTLTAATTPRRTPTSTAVDRMTGRPRLATSPLGRPATPGKAATDPVNMAATRTGARSRDRNQSRACCRTDVRNRPPTLGPRAVSILMALDDEGFCLLRILCSVRGDAGVCKRLRILPSYPSKTR